MIIQLFILFALLEITTKLVTPVMKTHTQTNSPEWEGERHEMMKEI